MGLRVEGGVCPSVGVDSAGGLCPCCERSGRQLEREREGERESEREIRLQHKHWAMLGVWGMETWFPCCACWWCSIPDLSGPGSLRWPCWWCASPLTRLPGVPPAWCLSAERVRSTAWCAETTGAPP